MARERAERLLSLTAFLGHSGRPRSLDEVREVFPDYKAGNAGRQMFFQDKRELLKAGFVVQEDDDKYWIEPDDLYLDRDFFLEDAERAALLVALQSLRDGAAAVPTVGAAFGGFGDVVGLTTGSGPTVQADLELAGAVRLLHRASGDRQQVMVTYGGKERVLEPYGLIHRWSSWYVHARDTGDGEVKNFRVERISDGPELTGSVAAFARPADLDLRTVMQEAWQFPSPERYEVVVVIDEYLAGRAAFEVGGSSRLDWQSDGSLLVAMTVTHLAAFRSWLLTYRDHAVVESPEPVRAHVRDWLRALVDAS